MKQIPQIEPLFGEEETNAVTEYMKSGGWLMEYEKTKELEKMIAKYVDAKYCVMVPNGTLAISAMLLSLDIKPGDEVIIPDYTMMATATAVSLIGAKPILVDIEPQTLAIDYKQYHSRRITSIPMFNTRKGKETKAVILVSINGRVTKDQQSLYNNTMCHNIPVIEDAAQALGSWFGDEHVGTMGDMGSFSFSMPKIVTAGAGGAVVTDKKEYYEKLKLIKNFGREKPGVDTCIYPGINLKFTDLQAVVLIEQMKKLPERTKRKKEMYKRYREALEGVRDIKFIDTNLRYTTPWFMDILVKNRKQRTHLIDYLKKKRIQTREFYPAIHMQLPYSDSTETRFVISSHISNCGFWLPSSLTLTDDDIDYVCSEVKKGLK